MMQPVINTQYFDDAERWEQREMEARRREAQDDSDRFYKSRAVERLESFDFNTPSIPPAHSMCKLCSAILCIAFASIVATYLLIHPSQDALLAKWDGYDARASETFHEGENYEMTECENEVNDGVTFPFLVDYVQNHDDDDLCRDEVFDCDWINPTDPTMRNETWWISEFKNNTEQIQKELASGRQLDVVMLGDAIMEHWDGIGNDVSEAQLGKDVEIFDQLFTRQGGGLIDGFALGIQGDRCSNLLYRLQNGEMPDKFEPRTWWILIGGNDWAAGLSVDSIVAGIIRISEVIHQKHPEAFVVINSLLPQGEERWDGNPKFDSLREINAKLDCYAKSVSRGSDSAKVHFFDATDIFLFTDPDAGTFINTAKMPDYAHPSFQGEVFWGKQIVKTVVDLIAGKILS